MRNILLILITLLVLSNGFSQATTEETHTFTLEDAIAFALKNNYSALNADRDLLDAQKQKWEVIATGLPQINGSIGYQNQLKQPVSVIPAEIFGGEPGTFAEVVFGQPQTATATATLSQQIFNGSYIVGVQATKTFLEYSQHNKEKTNLEIKKSVTEAYGNVLLADESILILEKNLANLEKTLFETTKIFENGLGDEESVEQLQITKSSVDSQLKNAVRLKKITLQMLNLLMGISIDAPTQLKDNLDDLATVDPVFEEAIATFNIENNIDYKLMNNLNEQRTLELKLAKSKALPTLNAFVNYGTSAFANEFNFLDSEQQWFDSSILGFDLSIPIFSSGLRSASTARAKIALEKAKTQRTEAQEQIRLQYENERSNYILAVEEYVNAKANLKLAERIENKNQIKYTEGLASSFELRQAQTQLYDGQQRYLQSMVDVLNRKTALQNILNNGN